MKKTVSLFLAVVLALSVSLSPVKAMNELPDENKLYDGLTFSISLVQKSIDQLANTLQPEVLSPLKQTFASFMKVAAPMGTVLSVVNGSVTFLRLIGVMKDPNAERLRSISESIQTIDEKMNQVDSKLNSITSAMAAIQASVEFNARSQKAILLHNNWREFIYRYMEDGMDKYINQYEIMLTNGLVNWFSNENSTDRKLSGIDLDKIVLEYVPSGNSYNLAYTDRNDYTGVPNSYRCLIINSDILPDNLQYNANTYFEDLKSAIVDGIYRAFSQKNYDAFQAQNYDLFTRNGWPQYVDQGVKQEIYKVAEDAANALIYRIASSQVNRDATFYKELIKVFSNYCNHLFGKEEGMEAEMASFYLTHAFEFETRDDLTTLCNEMMLKTGNYGMFVANIAGMSKVATDNEKLISMNQMVTSLQNIASCRQSCVTNRDRFCYITNSEIRFIDMTFNVEATMHILYGQGNGKRGYRDLSAGNITTEITTDLREGSHIIGDTDALIIMSMIKANGDSPSYAYFNEHIDSYTGNGPLVTSYGDNVAFPIDGTLTVHVDNVCGDYYPTGYAKNKLSEDASLEQFRYRKKVEGNCYNFATGKLESGQIMLAMAAYAEDHALWIVDECAFMAGASDMEHFYTNLNRRNDGYDYYFTYKVSNHCTALFSEPALTEGLSEGEKIDGYDALEAFRNLDIYGNTDNPIPSTGDSSSIHYFYLSATLLALTSIAIIKRKHTDNA